MVTLTDLKELIERRLEVKIDASCASNKIVDARKIYALLAIKFTANSYREIGVLINKDHSTISYYKKAAENLLTEPLFASKYDKILLSLNNQKQKKPYQARYEYHLKCARKYHQKIKENV